MTAHIRYRNGRFHVYTAQGRFYHSYWRLSNAWHAVNRLNA